MDTAEIKMVGDLGTELTLAGLWLATSLLCAPQGAAAAEPGREDIVGRLAAARPGEAADLHELVARGADLSGVDFRGAQMRGIDLKGANLSGAKLAKTVLDLAILSNADLSGADLSDASLYGAVAIQARLEGADLSRAVLLGNLSEARLDGARLLHAKGGANMKNQSMGLIRLVMTYASLDRADFSDADLAVCDGRFARFTNATLHRVNFSDCDLRGADFTGADLTDADMTGAKLEGAIFANIRGRESIKGMEDAQAMSKESLK